MNPHKMFMLCLGCSAIVSALVFLNGADEIVSMIQASAIVGAVIAAILFFTRNYWRNARRVSSS